MDRRNQCRLAATVGCVLFFTAAMSGQRLAIITPDAGELGVEYSERLAAQLSTQVKLLDTDQTAAAYRSLAIANPFNMTVNEGRSVASVIGCDLFLVVRSETLRRTPLTGTAYHESFATHFLVDGRTGELVMWRLKNFEAPDAEKTRAALFASVPETSAEIAGKARAAAGASVNKVSDERIEEVPDEGSPAAAKLKTPIPYKRIKPEYTPTAFLYDVKATVDIVVDIGSDGTILGTRVVRWAGFGLEQSVEAAVRAMNWRPAMRDGKPLPMRVLLRYNFTKLDKE